MTIAVPEWAGLLGAGEQWWVRWGEGFLAIMTTRAARAGGPSIAPLKRLACKCEAEIDRSGSWTIAEAANRRK